MKIQQIRVRTWAQPGGHGYAGVGTGWRSPDGRFAVVEVGKLDFVIGRVVRCGEADCTLELLQRYHASGSEENSTLVSACVEWSWMRYGFFKIVVSNFDEMTDEVHRFCFDPALYEREKQRLHPGG